MISLHWSHIATQHGACLFFVKISFSFVNFKYLSFFDCELIPAMGAPVAIFVAAWRNLQRGRRCVAESVPGTMQKI
jgi:hypothetical protein